MSSSKHPPTAVQVLRSQSLAWAIAKHFRLATLGAFHFFRHSSYHMTAGKSEHTQLLRYHCASSSWAAENASLNSSPLASINLNNEILGRRKDKKKEDLPLKKKK